MIQRILYQQITRDLFRGKVLIITGPRQGGKTTLMERIAQAYEGDFNWMNADEWDVREQFSRPNEDKLRRLAGDKKILFLDEAQRIENIGLCLKILADRIPEVQVVATGSSAFELTDKIREPLTGRKYEVHLYPVSTEEMILHHGAFEEFKALESRLVHGSYPEVLKRPGEERRTLTHIADSFLYKDLIALEGLKKPDLMERLLKALALQMGNEVSYHELGQTIGADKETVERYIHLLEKAFVIYRLPAFSRNVRNEIRKKRKVFFLDNGIRNVLISDFRPLDQRQDKGALWENFVIGERLKYLQYHDIHCNRYFWRTTQQQEIDYIEDRDGVLNAFEVKYAPRKKAKLPGTFATAYPNSRFQVIDRESFFDLVSDRPS